MKKIKTILTTIAFLSISTLNASNALSSEIIIEKVSVDIQLKIEKNLEESGKELLKKLEKDIIEKNNINIEKALNEESQEYIAEKV
tara:strand:+ start:2719 stop:2976 length:258 start_codon:yes stop_codon:yes gene_type:complete